MACAEIRGEFIRPNSSVNIGGDLLVDLSVPLDKTRSKNPPRSPRQNSNQRLGALRPKPTLQGSALEKRMSTGWKRV